MAEDRPNESPLWAEASGAAVIAPSLSKRNDGWFVDISPSAQFSNWVQRNRGRWLMHLGGTVSTFRSIREAVGVTGEFPLTQRDLCFIYEDYDPNFRPAQPIEGFDPEGFASSAKVLRGICSDGAYIYVIHASGSNGDPAVIRRIIRETGAVDGTWSVTTSAVMTNSGVVVWDLWTDGHLLAFASTTAVEVFNAASGGVAVWATSLGAHARRRVCADADHVYVTDADNLNAYVRASGSLAWQFDHGAEVWACASDGYYLYLFGDTSSHATGSELRRLRSSTGGSATTEGGTAVSSASVWDFAFGSAPTDGGDIRLGRGAEIFLSYASASPAASNQVVSRHRSSDGAEIWVTPQGPAFDIGYRISVDQDLIWGWTAPGDEPAPLTYGGTPGGSPQQVTTGPSRAYVPSIWCSDGSYVWTGGLVLDNTLSQVGTMAKWSRGSKVQHWQRVDPSADYTLPLQQLLIPV